LSGSYQFVFWLIVLAYQFAAYDSFQDWQFSRQGLKWFEQTSERRRRHARLSTPKDDYPRWRIMMAQWRWLWLITCLLHLGGVAVIQAQIVNPTAPVSPAAIAPGQPFIEWDTNTLVLIQRQGHYGRIIRLRQGPLVCGYDFRGRIWIRLSSNEGKTWQPAVQVAEWEFGGLTNTELLELQDGTLLCFYDARPGISPSAPADAPRARPFAICMARSADHGRTWQKPVTLYGGGREWGNGCWEPAAIQLPSGEIQVFFANEAPYRESDEQEITLLRSTNNAATWSAPERVSFRAKHRDGMPVPLVLQNGIDMVAAIEDNGLNGDFKPVILHTTRQDNWHSGAIPAQSPHRWGALARPLPATVYAGAPYIRQMPSGEVILSFQTSEQGGVRKACMAVAIGDSRARQFGPLSFPFPRQPNRPQLWNSLFVKNATTLTAVSETTVAETFGVWAIDGHLHSASGTTPR
jgi:hypothetical protein